MFSSLCMQCRKVYTFINIKMLSKAKKNTCLFYCFCDSYPAGMVMVVGDVLYSDTLHVYTMKLETSFYVPNFGEVEWAYWFGPVRPFVCP